MKQIFFDVETTGTNPHRHGILQLAGIVEINGKVIEKFNFFMKPFEDQDIDAEALEKNGIKRHDIDTFDSPEEVYTKFINFLNQYVDRFNRADKFHLIGYNSRFDDDFLREWFIRNGNSFYGSYFYWPALDVANMVAVKYRQKRSQFPNFQLMTVAGKLEIVVNLDKAHDAMYDVEITRELFDGMTRGTL